MLQPNPSKNLVRLLVALILATGLEIALTDKISAQGDTFRSLTSDGADHSCQVILRSARLILDPQTGLPSIDTDPTGRNWYTFEAFVDSASSLLKSGASVQLLYRGQHDQNWHTAPGVTVGGALNSLQRHHFRISQDTLVDRNGDFSSFPTQSDSLYMIPFIQSTDGKRIFDHNSLPNLSETYVLNAANNWKTKTDDKVCESAGRGVATIRFLGDWSIEHRGEIHPGQSLSVEYDLTRLPQCQASSYNGLPAWQTEAFVRFFPSGGEFSAALNSFQGGTMLSIPARFEIPAESTRAQVWFRTRGRGCEGGWDSNFGKNYDFEIRSGVAASPSWAGQWRLFSDTNECTELSNISALDDILHLSEAQLSNKCLAIEAEVLVPGLTTSSDSVPQTIQPQVIWRTDSGQEVTQWLTFTGRNGQNFRYRWNLPMTALRNRPWKTLDYIFQFSTDGLFWLQTGQETSSTMGHVSPRRIEVKP